MTIFYGEALQRQISSLGQEMTRNFIRKKMIGKWNNSYSGSQPKPKLISVNDYYLKVKLYSDKYHH